MGDRGLALQANLGVHQKADGLLVRDVLEGVVLGDFPLVPVDLGEAHPIGKTVVDHVLEDFQALVLAVDHVLGIRGGLLRQGRSEERRVGKVCVSTCRSRGSPYHSKKALTTRVIVKNKNNNKTT